MAHGKALLYVLEAAAKKEKKKAKHQRAQIATAAQAKNVKKLPHTYQLHVFVGSQLW